MKLKFLLLNLYFLSYRGESINLGQYGEYQSINQKDSKVSIKNKMFCFNIMAIIIMIVTLGLTIFTYQNNIVNTFTSFCGDLNESKINNTINQPLTCSDLYNSQFNNAINHTECTEINNNISCNTCDNVLLGDCSTITSECTEYSPERSNLSIYDVKCGEIYNTNNNDATLDPECSYNSNRTNNMDGTNNLQNSQSCDACKNYPPTECSKDTSKCNDIIPDRIYEPLNSTTNCGELSNFFNQQNEAFTECSLLNKTVSCLSCNNDSTGKCNEEITNCPDSDVINKQNTIITTNVKCNEIYDNGYLAINECNKVGQTITCADCTNLAYAFDCSVGNPRYTKSTNCPDYDPNKGEILVPNGYFECKSLLNFVSGSNQSLHPECSLIGTAVSCAACNSIECFTTGCKQYDPQEANTPIINTSDAYCGNLNNFIVGENGSNHPECTDYGTNVPCDICNYPNSGECPTETEYCYDYNPANENITVERDLTCSSIYNIGDNAINHTECSKSGKEDVKLLENTIVSCSDCSYHPATACPSTTLTCFDYKEIHQNTSLTNEICGDFIQITNGNFTNIQECSEIGTEIPCDSCTNILEGECSEVNTSSNDGLIAEVVLLSAGFIISILSFCFTNANKLIQKIFIILQSALAAAMIIIGGLSLSNSFIWLTGNSQRMNTGIAGSIFLIFSGILTAIGAFLKTRFKLKFN